jgi:DNA-3-methyladenine glycosylase II
MKTDESTGGRPRPLSPRLAAAALAERDPVMARLVADAGPPSFPRPTETHFAALVRSVTHQQLAGAAAQAIHGRLVAALDGEVTAKRLLATPTDALRAAGLSGNKVLSLQDLAAKVLDGTVVLDPRRLGR